MFRVFKIFFRTLFFSLFCAAAFWASRAENPRDGLEELARLHEKAEACTDSQERANVYAHEVNPGMERLRAAVDAMEPIVAREYWPVPTYDDILFYA